MKNLKQIKTTILGLFFLAAGAVHWWLTGTQVNYYVLAALWCASVLLMLAPDALIDIIKKKSDKI